ncbi:hypothetical protein MM236_02455 [Belliella sp. DSM 107340]|uniref:Uncharacterized protein n=1 Tax=Belliella calami TaxID=2923436 RepID=A0ABS9UK63_9BACT|nr:hypothetical protein [Belliella calami]MCH7396825.1 hypothetical protein [Belliella calami]
MFEIDIITISIAIVSMVAFAVPFYINNLKVKKEKLNKENLLQNFLKSHNLNLNIQDNWRKQYFIGMDTYQNKLVYIQNLADIKAVILDVREIKQVKINEESRVVGAKGNSRKIIDGLHLQFTNHQGKVIGLLEFYDGEKFSDLVGEPILIKKWEATILAEAKSTGKKESLVL